MNWLHVQQLYAVTMEATFIYFLIITLFHFLFIQKTKMKVGVQL